MAKVAFITSTFPNFQGCGTGIYAGYLTEALTGQGHEVHVITSAHQDITQSWGKVTVHKAINGWGLSQLPRMMQKLMEIRPQILHVNHPTVFAAKKSNLLVNVLPESAKQLLGLPTLLTLHEFNKVSLLGRLKILPMILSSQIVTVTNERYRQSVLKHIPKNHEKRIRVVDIGALFQPSQIMSNRDKERAKWNLKPEDRVIGFIGFITPPKGFHNLIDSLAPLLKANPNFKIIAFSSWNLTSPKYKAEVLEKIDRAGIRNQVQFTGFIENNELWEALECVDLCVFPFDYPVEERSSGSLRMALFRGIPTVVFAENRGYEESGLKHGQNIWFTPHMNGGQLAEDVKYLLKNDQVRNSLKEGALQLRPNLSYDHVSNEMSRLYAEILGH